MNEPSWYQIIDIDGKPTNGKPGKGDVETTWKNVKKFLPDNLNDYRILDLGCNAGMYCVNSILMGAKEAVGIEFNKEYYKQALFVKEYMEKKHDMSMNIKYIHGTTENHIEYLGKFDIVFAFSVVGHLRGYKPWLSRLCNKVLLLEGHQHDSKDTYINDLKKDFNSLFIHNP